MSNQITELIKTQENRFTAAGNSLDYKQESLFASQQLMANPFTTKVALNNKTSVVQAFLNVSAVGLTLNPAKKLAYLVPRDNRICLDISYMGLVQIAIDTGSVIWVKAEPVYKNDKFTYKGVCTMPDIEIDPFGDRGDFVGVYCVARLHNNEPLVGLMSADEIYEVRGRSKAFTSGKSCPWVTDFIEMAKKTLIKRESKTWPKSDRLREASDILNDHEGYRDEFIMPMQSDLSIQQCEAIASQMRYLVSIGDDPALYDEYHNHTSEEMEDIWSVMRSEPALRRKIKEMEKSERVARKAIEQASDVTSV